jgi:hypothetical protein
MGVISAILRTGDSVTKKIKSGNARMGAWSPSHYRPTKVPMMQNRVSLSGPQLGFPWVLLLTRVLLPVATGAGLYYAVSKEDEKDEDKKTFGIENWKIAYSSVAAGISTAAFLGGGILPEDIRPIATVVGALGAAASVAILFWPSEKQKTSAPQTPGPEIPSRECLEAYRFPMASSAELRGMLTMALDPEQLKTGGLIRSGPNVFQSGFWNIESSPVHEFDFTIRNETDRTLCFFIGLETLQQDGHSRSVFMSRPGIAGRMGRMMLTLAAGESKTIRLATLAYRGPHTVEMQVFRNRDDAGWLVRSERLAFDVR